MYLLAADTEKGDASIGGEREVEGNKNKAELLALIGAMERIKKPCTAHIYTESIYLAAAFLNGWIRKWQKNGWKSARGRNIRHREEWEKLLKLQEQHELVFHLGEKGRFGDWINFQIKGGKRNA